MNNPLSILALALICTNAHCAVILEWQTAPKIRATSSIVDQYDSKIIQASPSAQSFDETVRTAVQYAFGSGNASIEGNSHLEALITAQGLSIDSSISYTLNDTGRWAGGTASAAVSYMLKVTSDTPFVLDSSVASGRFYFSKSPLNHTAFSLIDRSGSSSYQAGVYFLSNDDLLFSSFAPSGSTLYSNSDDTQFDVVFTPIIIPEPHVIALLLVGALTSSTTLIRRRSRTERDRSKGGIRRVS